MDNPLCTEIRDVCLSQQLGVEFETNKHYPREIAKDHIHSGRVRVQIKNDDGSPLNENIISRKMALTYHNGTRVPLRASQASEILLFNNYVANRRFPIHFPFSKIVLVSGHPIKIVFPSR